MKSIRLALMCTGLAFAVGLTADQTPAFADRVDKEFKRKKAKRDTNQRPRASRSFGLSTFFNFSGRKRRNLDEIRARQAEANKPPAPYIYQADKRVALVDRKLKQPAPGRPVFTGPGPDDYDPTPQDLGVRLLDDSLAQTIFETLKTGDNGAWVTAKQARAVLAFYRKRNHAALWTGIGEVPAETRSAIEYFQAANLEGLDPADYRIPELTEAKGDFDAIESDLQRLARFDIEMTAAALRYAQHASGGRISPNRLSRYHDLRPPRLAAGKALQQIADAGDRKGYLASLHPVHPAYAALRGLLVSKLEATSTPVVHIRIPAGRNLRPGDSDPRIVLLRQRLEQEGLLPASASVGEFELMTAGLPGAEDGAPKFGSVAFAGRTEKRELYGTVLADAVRSFQKSAGLQADAIVGPATLRALNGERKITGTARLVQNMERLRWLPREFGRTHVFVNQPAYELSYMHRGKAIWRSRVIVGKPRNQTSFFSDVMETVVFNPYWGVPQSILAKEMLPQLQANPSYLDQKGFELYNARGRKVSSSDVDWWDYSGKVPFSVRQPPGARNALGEVKFLFPNKHSIYMHDTPLRGLFKRSARALSHGCVRVQNPRRLAEIILGWNQTRVASRINAGKNDRVSVKNSKIKVHLTYFTAWPDAAGKVRYYKDIYGRDRRIAAAFAAEAKVRR